MKWLGGSYISITRTPEPVIPGERNPGSGGDGMKGTRWDEERLWRRARRYKIGSELR